jgi:hypothetical protein
MGELKLRCYEKNGEWKFVCDASRQTTGGLSPNEGKNNRSASSASAQLPATQQKPPAPETAVETDQRKGSDYGRRKGKVSSPEQGMQENGVYD